MISLQEEAHGWWAFLSLSFLIGGYGRGDVDLGESVQAGMGVGMGGRGMVSFRDPGGTE